MAGPARRHLPWAFLLVALAEILLFWGALVRGETFIERDLASFLRPTKALLVPLSKASSGLPLWNPFFSSGQPFAANPQYELFHPMTALFFLLPFETAFRLQILLPPLVGAWAAHLLARTLGRSREAAALCAVAWAFGGYLVSTTILLPILFAACLVPAVLAFTIRCARERKGSNLAGLALTTALVGLAGEPSTLLMLPLLAITALAHERMHRRFSGSSSVRPALGFALGLALAAPALVPGLHHASKTVRLGGLDGTEAGMWSFPPVRVAEALSPHVMGHVEKGDEAWYWGRDAYTGKGYPYLYSVYPGLCVTILAACGAGLGGRRLWPWLATAGLGVLLAVGEQGPLWRPVRLLPVLDGLRYPEKFALLFSLPLVVVASFGLDWALGPGRRRRRTVAGGALAATAVLGVVLAAGITAADRLRPQPWGALGISPHLEHSFAAVAARDALRAALVASSGYLALAAARRKRRWGAAAIAAVTAADLALAGRSVIPSVPVHLAAPVPPALAPLVRRPPHGPLFHLAAADPVRSQARGIAKPPIPAQWGIPMTLERDFDLTFRRSTEMGRRLFWKAVLARPSVLPQLLERRSVAAVLKFRAGAFIKGGVLRPPPGAADPLELAVVADPQPLVFGASRIARISHPDEWVRAVLEVGDDIARTVVLDGESARRLPERPSSVDVLALALRPGFVSIDVAAHGPLESVLAVNQSWDEGWSVTVDGEPQELLLADVSLSAVAIGPGRHHVELVYRDPWVTAGLALSGLALLLLAAMVLVDRPRPARHLDPVR
jgi:hypothetical protein